MGEENESKDPPPPSLNKPQDSPPPPSLGKPQNPPSPPPTTGASGGSAGGAPVVQEAPVRVDEEEEGDELKDGAIAPVNTRLIAAIIDGVVASALYYVVIKFLPGEVLDGLGLVAQAAYLVTRDSLPFLGGQSIGKTAMKLKVVKKDGSSMVNDWQTGLIRNAILVVPFFGPLIEAIVLFSREEKPERGKRLGDEWAKTKVVVSRPDEGTGGDSEE